MTNSQNDQTLQVNRIIRGLLKSDPQSILNEQELQLLKTILLIKKSQRKSIASLSLLLPTNTDIVSFQSKKDANLAYKQTLKTLQQLDRKGYLNKTIFISSYFLTYLFASGFSFAIFNQSAKELPKIIQSLDNNPNINKAIAAMASFAVMVSNVIFAKIATENILREILKKDNFSSLSHLLYIFCLSFIVLNSVAVDAAFPFDAKDEIYQTLFGLSKNQNDFSHKLFYIVGCLQTAASAVVLELMYSKFFIEIFEDVSLATIKKLPNQTINFIKENKGLALINTALIGIAGFGFYAFLDNSRDIYRRHFTFLSNDGAILTSTLLAIAGQTPITFVSMASFGKFVCDLVTRDNNHNYQLQLDQALPSLNDQQQILQSSKLAKIIMISTTLSILINSLGNGLLAMSDSSSKAANLFRFLSSFMVCFCIFSQGLIEEKLQKSKIIKSLLQTTNSNDLMQESQKQESPKSELQKPHSLIQLISKNHNNAKNASP